MAEAKLSDLKKIFKSDAVIFNEGDRGDAAYLIRSGEVALFKKTPKGEVRLATIGRNAIFGEMALLDGAPCMATAIAMGETTCSLIGPEQFERRLVRLNMEVRAIFDSMLHYVRKTLPWEHRHGDPRLAAETDDDVIIRRMMPRTGMRLPPEIEADPALHALYDILHAYVRRRQPIQPPS
jgi:CRP-like cAMP-binding protein